MYGPGASLLRASRFLAEPQSDQAQVVEMENDLVIMQLSSNSSWLPELREEEEFKEVIQHLDQGQQVPKLFLENGELMRISENGRIQRVVPRSHRKALFEQTHTGVFAGHLSARKVACTLAQRYYWPTMYDDVAKWHRSCLLCVAHNTQPRKIPPLKAIITTKPYELVGIDVLELGLTTAGNKYVVTMIDAFSKWCSAYPVPNKSSTTIARTIVEEWIAREGRCPQFLLSDRGREFENELMQEIARSFGIEQKFTVGYNPRENGLTERMNRTLISMLAKSTVVPMEWDRKLPFVLYAYNTAPQEVTGESPYFLLTGLDPIFPDDLTPSGDITMYMIDLDDYRTELLVGLNEIRAQASKNIAEAQAKAKKYYDERYHVREGQFKVGQRVLVFTPPQKTRNHHPKFMSQYQGPYRILELSENSALVRRIGKQEEPFRVQLDHLKRVPDEVGQTAQIGPAKKRRKLKENKRQIKQLLKRKKDPCRSYMASCCRKTAIKRVKFANGDEKKWAVALNETLCGQHQRCEEAECAGGVSLGEVVRFAPAEVASIRFIRTDELAAAVAFWRSARPQHEKVDKLLSEPYTCHQRPSSKDIYDAAVALTAACPHRKRVLEITFGYPLFSDLTENIAQRDMYAEANESLRAEIMASKGSTKKPLAVFGEKNAQTVARVCKEAEWIAINGVHHEATMSFQNFYELCEPWEYGPTTRVGIFMMDMQATEADVRLLHNMKTNKAGVKVIVVAPPAGLKYINEHRKMREWYLSLKDELQSEHFILAGWDDGPDHLNITAMVGNLPIGDGTKPCNDRAELNVLGAAKLLRAINYAYDVHLAIRDNSQQSDAINPPQCLDVFNNHRQWRDVGFTTRSRSSIRGQYYRRQPQGRPGKANPYRHRGSGANRRYH